jgi:GNAT superfamily N-acetyltransferase
MSSGSLKVLSYTAHYHRRQFPPTRVLHSEPYRGYGSCSYDQPHLATLADQRGKGIGSVMLTYALNLAQSLGYKNAVLQASQDGIELYKKMVFQTFTQYF